MLHHSLLKPRLPLPTRRLRSARGMSGAETLGTSDGLLTKLTRNNLRFEGPVSLSVPAAANSCCLTCSHCSCCMPASILLATHASKSSTVCTYSKTGKKCRLTKIPTVEGHDGCHQGRLEVSELVAFNTHDTSLGYLCWKMKLCTGYSASHAYLELAGEVPGRERNTYLCPRMLLVLSRPSAHRQGPL